MEELYKKHLSDPDKHNAVVTYLESDILSVKSSGPKEASQQTKLMEVMKFHQSHFKS